VSADIAGSGDWEPFVALQIDPGSGPARREMVRMREAAVADDGGLSFEPGRISVTARVSASFEHR
jgi:hypothetical protein